MKTRILTGTVAGVLFAAVLIQPWKTGTNLLMAVLAAIAVYELCVTTKMAPQKWMWIPSAVFAAAIPMWRHLPFNNRTIFIFACGMAFVLYLCVIGVVGYKKIRITSVMYVAFMTILVGLTFAAIAFLRRRSLMLLGLVLIIPWVNDTAAYFIGTWFGKHKLCPEISPKKTVEGLIGGLVCAVGVEVLVAAIYKTVRHSSINLWWIALIALICAPLAVVGDLFASQIKRECDIKDYGRLLPGHGGIMDRFDSFLFVSFPAYIMISLLPLFS